MTQDWVDVTDPEWNRLVEDAYGSQHAIIREVAVRADDVVRPDLGLSQIMTARGQVLVQLQEEDIPSIVLWFEGVTRIEYRAVRDQPPTRHPAGRRWIFEFLSLTIETERGFAARPGSLGLGSSITIAELAHLIADPK